MAIQLKQCTAEQVFDALKNEFSFINAKGSIRFNLNDFEIIVKQNSVVGNILEDWLADWLDAQGIANEHNLGQIAPDFWLNPTDKTKDLLELKCFYRGPGFDIANFLSYVNEIIDKPYRLHSKYLLILYDMNPQTHHIFALLIHYTLRFLIQVFFYQYLYSYYYMFLYKTHIQNSPNRSFSCL